MARGWISVSPPIAPRVKKKPALDQGPASDGLTQLWGCLMDGATQREVALLLPRLSWGFLAVRRYEGVFPDGAGLNKKFTISFRNYF